MAVTVVSAGEASASCRYVRLVFLPKKPGVDLSNSNSCCGRYSPDTSPPCPTVSQRLPRSLLKGTSCLSSPRAGRPSARPVHPLWRPPPPQRGGFRARFPHGPCWQTDVRSAQRRTNRRAGVEGHHRQRAREKSRAGWLAGWFGLGRACGAASLAHLQRSSCRCVGMSGR